MDTTPYILNEFKALTLENTVKEAKQLFEESSFTHFPIVKNEQLIGLISEESIKEIEENEKEIGYFQYLFSLFYIEKENDLLNLLGVFASNNTNLVPIIIEHNKYIGYFEINDILQLYNETPFLKSEGVVISLEKESRDYSFSQICQIIESNNAKIIGLFISEINATTTKITVKINSNEINEILQSFRRYNYVVLSSHKEDFYIEDLKERSIYLQKYLNI
ncbi:CBS domain-containing protein [Lutibacter sp.]|jgi:predicted transcriptional regulator|uniref:CBS domain-containing protein n=1 Tax=Lutibacter sp. TaxID=1925666 RepID=UPI001A317FB9|nr:CBS domain-containing protein [Lutibacter sp.]MBI9039976.1 CBS domain-containing protein [Lutibacter sp.]